jgi:thiamine pyrophosphate-dependent acetolactate synthase large subunit-like protein
VLFRSLKAESFAHLKDALREAVKADRPTVIEIEDAAAQNW